MLRFRIAFATTLALSALLAASVASADKGDVAGGKDYAGIGRFAVQDRDMRARLQPVR